MEELKEFVKFVLNIEGQWSVGKDTNLNVFKSKCKQLVINFWKSTKTVTLNGKKKGQMREKIRNLLSKRSSFGTPSCSKSFQDGGSMETFLLESNHSIPIQSERQKHIQKYDIEKYDQKVWTIINNLTHKLEDCFKIIDIVKEEREDNKAVYRQRNIESEHKKTEIERLRNELMAKNVEIIHLKNQVDNLNWFYEQKPKANDEQLRNRRSTNKFPPTWPSVPTDNRYELLSTTDNEPVSKSPS